MTEARFINCLKLSADSPDKLRRCDVFRVVDSACDQGFGLEFCAWLEDKRPDLEADIDYALEEIDLASAEALNQGEDL